MKSFLPPQFLRTARLERLKPAACALFFAMLCSVTCCAAVDDPHNIDISNIYITGKASSPNVNLKKELHDQDILITTSPPTKTDPTGKGNNLPLHGYYFDHYIFEPVTIVYKYNFGPDKGKEKTSTLIVGPGENPQTHLKAPTTTIRDLMFIHVAKNSEAFGNFKISVQGWRPHIETNVDGILPIPRVPDPTPDDPPKTEPMSWPRKRGHVFTGSLKLYDRNGDSKAKWNWDINCGGAIAEGQLNPDPDPATGRYTDTVLDTFYAGILTREPASDPGAMGRWQYTCPNQPIGRTGDWIHEDFNEKIAPGTHGCAGIRGNWAFFNVHPADRAHVDLFQSKMAEFTAADNMPDWDHTLTAEHYYRWKPPGYPTWPKHKRSTP